MYSDNFLECLNHQHHLQGGEHLGTIRYAYRNDPESAVGNINIVIDLLPDEFEEPIIMVHAIPIRWEPASTLYQTLGQLECPPKHGERLDLKNLIGITVMVEIEVTVLADGSVEHLVTDIRKATEAEATRTDWDPEDESLDIGDECEDEQDKEADAGQELDDFDKLNDEEDHNDSQYDTEDDWDDLG